MSAAGVVNGRDTRIGAELNSAAAGSAGERLAASVDDAEHAQQAWRTSTDEPVSAGLLSGMSNWLSKTLSLTGEPTEGDRAAAGAGLDLLQQSGPADRDGTVTRHQTESRTRENSKDSSRRVMSSPRQPQHPNKLHKQRASLSHSSHTAAAPNDEGVFGFWSNLNFSSLVPKVQSTTMHFVPRNRTNDEEDSDDSASEDERPRDLHIEEATAEGERFADHVSPAQTPGVLPGSKLQKRPSLAFVNATKAGYANPLTLEAVARQGGEKVAMDLERGLAEKERRMSSIDLGNNVSRKGSLFGNRTAGGPDSPKGNREFSAGSRRERTSSGQQRDLSQSARIVEEDADRQLVQSPVEDTFGELPVPSTSTSSVAPPRHSEESSASASTTKKLKKDPPLGEERLPSAQQEQDPNRKKSSFFNRFSKRRLASDASIPSPVIVDAPVENLSPQSARLRAPSDMRGKIGKIKIRTVKTKTKNKAKRDFGSLFLAQELVISANTNEPSPNGLEFERTTTMASLNSLNSADMEAPPVVQKKPYAVWACEFSPDGRYLAVAGRDRVVRVWQVIGSESERQAALSPELVEIERSRDPNPTISRPCGSAMTPATAKSSSEHVMMPPTSVMPVFRSKPIREYRGHTGDVLDLAWSKNNFLLSSSMDKTVRLWHVSREDCLCAFEHVDFVTSIAFHPKDDRFFASGSLDCKLRIWNIPEKKVHIWTELPELITTVSFTKEGSRVVAGTFLGNCTFFKSDTCALDHTLECKTKSKGRKITNIATFPLSTTSKERVLITSNDSKVRLYNAHERVVEAKYAGHENASSQIRATFSDDGKYVISGSEDGQVYIWDSNVVEQNGGGWRILMMKDGPGYESFPTNAHVNTCALFAPLGTRRSLALSGDPIFSASAASISSDSLHATGGLNRSPMRGGKGGSANDAIVIVTDDASGIISVYRNSELPPSITGKPALSPRKQSKR